MAIVDDVVLEYDEWGFEIYWTKMDQTSLWP